MTWTDTYRQAHHRWQQHTAPGFFAASGGESQKIMYPPVTKSNGLTRAIVNFLTWEGHRATRINTTGRIVKAPQRQASGTVLTVSKYIPGTTRRGTADISATIKGRACMFEVKAGNDKPSVHQLKEQALERSAGGVYEFIYTIQQFFEWYFDFMAKST